MLELMGHESGFGNSSATTHRYGWQAQQVLEEARATTAQALGADPMGIYFTSGATESINLALTGLINTLWQGNLVSRWSPKRDALPHVITSAAEHKATLDALAYLAAQQRIELTVLKPSALGVVTAGDVADVIQPHTVLVSLLHVNNELGVINPISAIGQLCLEQGIFLHVDAVQSFGKTPLCLSGWHVDLVSFSAHKAYGPKGVGALYVSPGLRGELVPLAHGGGQERGLRPGTVPVHQIRGMACAFQLASERHQLEIAEYECWRSCFLAVLSDLPNWVLHGEGADCVPNILSLGFRGVDGETLLMALTEIAVSSGSACNSITLDPSHVLLACGVNRTLAASTLRLSFGRFSSETQLLAAAEHICSVIGQLRQNSL
jgi:cysteine desulfurase